MKTRPQIPLIDLGDAGRVQLLEAQRARAERLIRTARDRYGGWVIDTLDAATRRWARKGVTPYLDEMERAAAIGLPGGLWFMNLCLEWGCTTGAVDEDEGVCLRRTLDWAFDDLGRDVVVARHETVVGDYYDITWPGFFGVATAMAPGRFCAAINQAPIPQVQCAGLALPWPFGWAVSRIHTLRGADLPPAHLLRRVMETCANFDEALTMLRDAPLALPVLFTLAGTRPGEAVVIERLAGEADVHDDCAVVANAWLNPRRKGRPRGADNPRRRALMQSHCQAATSGFCWVESPILNSYTRVAVVANAATGLLLVKGYEAEESATEDFDLAQAVAR